jgi:phenylacetate-CoA ligase
MSPTTLPGYIDHLRRARHVYLEGYPSPMAMLGKFILDQGIDWPCPPRAVFTTAEQLLPEYRRWIEEGFKTRVYDQYGQNEKVASITEYSCGHLHYDLDYGVIEFVPFGKADDGQTICEMICTGFENFAAPMIRYRVGDLALLPDNPPPCPHYAGPIVACLYGRTAQALISRDGRRYTNISVIAKRCQHIDGMQCVQDRPGVVEVRVVRGAGFTDEDERNILRQFRGKMGEIDFVIRFVDAIERSSGGKFLSIISRVPPDEAARPSAG